MDGLLSRPPGSLSPSLLPSQESRWRHRQLRLLGYSASVRTPNTTVFRDRLLSRILSKLPFLVEAWYWALVYWVYQLGRAFTAVTIVEGAVHVARKHALQVIEVEKRVHVFWEPAIQRFFISFPRLMTAINWLYSFIHIPGTIAFLVWLYYYTITSSRVGQTRIEGSKAQGQTSGSGAELYEARRRTMAVCNLLAFVVFTLWPCMPPRLLSDPDYDGSLAEAAKSHDFVDTVHGEGGAKSVWTQNRFCNQYAAMPSLHFGYALMIGVTIMTIPLAPKYRHSRSVPLPFFNQSQPELAPQVRLPSARRLACVVVGILYPFAILVAIISTANHFILDAVAGGLVCLIGWKSNAVLLNLLPLEDHFLWWLRIHKPGQQPLLAYDFGHDFGHDCGHGINIGLHVQQGPRVTTLAAARSPQLTSAIMATASSSAPNGDTQSAAVAADAGAKKDAPADSAPAAEANTAEKAVAANGVSAPKKNGNGNGGSSGGKRKSGGVPEHKNKKTNKRKSTAAKTTHLDAQPGDFYFARLKSYPPWPAVICDESMLPTTLLNTRPITTKKADGTYNEAYADGGKKAHERTFPVMFLSTNEFAWIHNTDLTELNPEDCKDVTEKGKNKSLIEAYKIAAEGHDLQHFKELLIDHAKFLEQEEALKAEKEAEKAQKAAKKKRKSEAKAQDDDADARDADADDADAAPKSAKKRKKAAETDDEEPEKVTAAEDEDMADAADAEPEAPVDPEEARKAREREVLFLRHKLQKGFLSRDQAPQEDDMPQMSNFIKKLENYQDLEVSIIRATKINKVLKALLKLNTIPKDEEFNFRKRSVELLGKWKILGAEPHDAEVADKESKDTPTTNGVNGEASVEDSKLDEAEDKPAADDEPVKAESNELPPRTEQTAAAETEPAAAQPTAADHAPDSAQVETGGAVKTEA
ncbi:hypothetical protein DV737_g3476, partial [Chaetothyriales sp. CBS 132003]